MARAVNLGLDLGSTVCEAVARDADGKILGALKFPPGERELRRAGAQHTSRARCGCCWTRESSLTGRRDASAGWSTR